MIIDYERINAGSGPLFGKDSGAIYDSGTIDYECYLYSITHFDCESGDTPGYITGTSTRVTWGKLFLLPMVLKLEDIHTYVRNVEE